MWKNFFYYSKSQRIAIIVLLSLTVCVFTLNKMLPILIKPKKEVVSDDFLKKVQKFRASLQSKDSLRRVQWQQEYYNKYPSPGDRTTAGSHYRLTAFDPNVADSALLREIGLRPYVISNVLRYRSRGGKFVAADDFSKIYGLSTEKFEELKPYIRIEPTEEKPTVAAHDERDGLTESETVENVAFTVELNTADTTELKTIKGIGDYLADRIVQFRNASGGFISVEQLKEIQGMRLENYERIKDFCTADAGLVQKIRVNTASIERLNRHPYLNFYQSKTLYEFRRKKGKLHSITEIVDLKEFDEELIRKITPYLDFN
ncbi:MAG: helix-hairpin-helix domain-containing protein [Prevotellaceae bacterium]|jgi:competence ComEA-like helix-hairpin-helix protein|nr:helix-hairpin-helix domain-containing protein [Prevotellaceae bacterium]